MMAITIVALAGVARADQRDERMRAIGGAWVCKGSYRGVPLRGELDSRSDLDGAWLRDALYAQLGAGTAAPWYKLVTFVTFDPGSGKWRAIALDSDGAQRSGHAEPIKAGRYDAELDVVDARGKSQLREHRDASVKMKLHIWAEESRDGGTTWAAAYDYLCSR